MFRELANKRRYEGAAADLQPGETLCATLVGDKPVYFSMPVDASDEEVKRRAFELREGRSMSSMESTLMSIAESRADAAGH